MHSEPPRFRVAVDAVRIDVVVTDCDGRIVTDLSADDFEVRQDGRPQKVTFAQFIPVLVHSGARSRTGRSHPAVPATSRFVAISGLPRLPRLLRWRARAFSARWRSWSMTSALSVESLFYVKRALHTFIDNDLQPADSGRHPADRRLHWRAAAVHHGSTDSARRRRCAALERLLPQRCRGLRADQPDRRPPTTGRALADSDDFTAVNALRRSIAASGTLGR